MPWFVIVILLIAAILHTAWNLILKQAGEKLIAAWLALVVSVLVGLPVLAFIQIPLSKAWPYILASAVLEASYYAVLVQAYGKGDFSLVYPVARGAAPALLVTWSILFLGDRPSINGAIGLGLIIAGLLIVGGSAWLANPEKSPERASLLLALLVALCISLYSVVDGAAVKQFSPAAYIVVVFAITAILMTPLMVRRYRAPALWAEWQAHWRPIVLIGLLSLGAYFLVLVAYRIATVSYAGAIREVSIILAALAGWVLLGEEMGRLRVLGAVIVFAGILIIAVA